MQKAILWVIAILILSTQWIFSADSIVLIRNKKHKSKKQRVIPTPIPIYDKLLWDERYTTCDLAFQLLLQRNAKILMKTNYIGEKDSNPFLMEWAKSHDAQIFFVDRDAIAFFEQFDQSIDFLYLDGYPLSSEQDHLSAMIAAYPHLSDHCVVMIDDHQELAMEWIQKKGWKRIKSPSQAILVKKMLNHNRVDDPQDLEQFIDVFPKDEYIVCETPNQGKFYVEPHKNDVIKNFLRSGRVWDPHILDKIYQYVKPGTVALDIGAHIGTFTIAMAKIVGKNGTVYAFEPQKKIFRELNKNCELNDVRNVICHRIALGDQQQLIEMDKTFSENEGSTNIGHGGDVAEMRTIDSFHFKNVSFIKIDVERTEEQVLDGMVKTLQNNRPVIVIELQGGYLFETAPSHIREKILHSMHKLQALGYEVTRIYQHDYLALPR
jgi:FkbM family methyltransferase